MDYLCEWCECARSTNAGTFCVARNGMVSMRVHCALFKPKLRDPDSCYWSQSVQDMQATLTCCRQREKNGDFHPVGYEDCRACPEYHSKYRKTKGDELRELSDTELAAFMAIVCRACPPCRPCRCDGDPELCKKCWGEWLRKEKEPETPPSAAQTPPLAGEDKEGDA